MSDKYLEDDGSISTLVEKQPTSFSGPCCEKCNAPISSHEAIACRQCGWYASIGSFVEIDQNWEAATDPKLAATASTEQTEVPKWAWILMGCIAGVIIESVAARLLTPAVSAARTTWSVTQLFGGSACFAVCHSIAFALLMKASTETNLTDIFLHPLQSWAQLLRELPRRQWVCCIGFSGLTAAAMSIVVIGGLPYERLIDWGTKPPPKLKLLGAIMSQADGAAAEDDKNLEEAVGDLAGKAELDEDGKKKKKKVAPKKRPKDDCVILGYQTTGDGLIYSLLLGGEHYGRLVYAGKVSPNLPTEENLELAKQLAEIKSRKPFVKVPIDQAHWVTPQFILRVSYKRKGKQGGLYDTKLEDLVGVVEMKGK